MKRILAFAQKNWPEGGVPFQGAITKSSKPLKLALDPQVVMKNFIVADLRRNYGLDPDLAMKVAEIGMLNIDFTEDFLNYLAQTPKLRERFISGEVKSAVKDMHEKKFREFLALAKIKMNKGLSQKFTMRDDVFVLDLEG
ncbi:hypothetical protein A3J90_07565 [candidate division WOR-1 bacterium RIFOXYC2_FULL_37_10]|uniref:Uncharacterized protein n=1 Tax=candidate division WOR-1 bacterium RIFOXYB2_FULL_37_13 TaxID=1802579 RepID=A0A1F4SQG0_UNCSA|nr:MAG: hypothetical protein A2310_07820 [candidate division WOR-1 bacterium RIFOXYB2_FULL_37_13]OGC34464.1 MAG: hypothetical protein A3J90_07565 [candidate division WOR-1 bacterium RIFOXYC2_FULL_37_10]